VGVIAMKGIVFKEFQDIIKVFLKEVAGILLNYYFIKHKINLEPSIKPLYKLIYALLKKELKVLQEYLKINEEKG
jgi:hypothetical protein